MSKFIVISSDGRTFRDIWAYSPAHAKEQVYIACCGRVGELTALRS